jgi:hypothetical protein
VIVRCADLPLSTIDEILSYPEVRPACPLTVHKNLNNWFFLRYSLFFALLRSFVGPVDGAVPVPGARAGHGAGAGGGHHTALEREA